MVFILAFKYLSHELKRSVQPILSASINSISDGNQVPAPPSVPTSNPSVNAAKLKASLPKLSDSEIVELCRSKKVPLHNLETLLQDVLRAVRIRRMVIGSHLGENSSGVDELPFLDYDYEKVYGTCCENVIGYTQIPIGVAGPLMVDGAPFYVPMATTEGCLVASTNRGCSALRVSTLFVIL